mmetsp:Transcript_27960/g.59627  ORF Transcript_27960/g.59627 Transcript_27960/m.59627 type:complete len:92 (-) Transcript_27960:174-449(-)
MWPKNSSDNGWSLLYVELCLINEVEMFISSVTTFIYFDHLHMIFKVRICMCDGELTVDTRFLSLSIRQPLGVVNWFYVISTKRTLRRDQDN